MQQKILSTLNRIYSKPFDDIQLHRDMIGYVGLTEQDVIHAVKILNSL